MGIYDSRSQQLQQFRPVSTSGLDRLWHTRAFCFLPFSALCLLFISFAYKSPWNEISRPRLRQTMFQNKPWSQTPWTWMPWPVSRGPFRGSLSTWKPILTCGIIADYKNLAILSSGSRVLPNWHINIFDSNQEPTLTRRDKSEAK